LRHFFSLVRRSYSSPFCRQPYDHSERYQAHGSHGGDELLAASEEFFGRHVVLAVVLAADELLQQALDVRRTGLLEFDKDQLVRDQHAFTIPC